MTRTPKTRTPKTRTPKKPTPKKRTATRTAKTRTPKKRTATRTPEMRTPTERGPKKRTPTERGPETRTPEMRTPTERGHARRSTTLDRVRALEAAMRAEPQDAEVALVYADALASRGDPRGDLIVLQYRAETARDGEREALEAAVQAQLDGHAAALLGPLANPNLSLVWHRGFVRRIAWREAPGDPASIEAALGHPSARYVTELVLDPVSCDAAVPIVGLPQIDQLERLEILLDDWLGGAAVIDALAARPRPELRALVFGSTEVESRADRGDLYIAWDHNPLVSSDSLDALADSTPHLAELELRGEYLFGGLAHPALVRLTLFGDAINGLPWAYLAGEVVLPRLERLEITMLMDEYRYPSAFPLTLDATRTPALRELAIHNPSCRYSDGTENTLFGLVGESAILPQLEALTIADLHQTDDANLARLAKRFRHLQRFHIASLVADGDHDDDGEPAEAVAAFEARCRERLPNATFGPSR